MKAQIIGLRVAAIVFAVVALAQLTRLAMQWDVVVADYAIPLWPSAIALVVAGGLSVWMWQLASADVTERGTKPQTP